MQYNFQKHRALDIAKSTDNPEVKILAEIVAKLCDNARDAERDIKKAQDEAQSAIQEARRK